ncbi:hypothetical protein G3T36_15760 [Diaminobutyricibacter tongyongensis]|uniref:Uncharacterized protein n=1 Tax=Leifsonia tongyongensis TaxID=1268043 RepID=A0A6L9Y165_9MICO|nr:hypothetical protein [Diaminobutyricibacter tongyongensis]
MTASLASTVNSATERDALNRSRLEIGFNLTGCVLIAYQAAIMLLNLGSYPALPFTIAAWVILIATLIIGLVIHRRYRELLPTGLFIAALAAWTVVVALDIAGTWNSGDQGAPPTAAVAVGAALLLCVTLRPPRDIVVTSIALGIVLAGAFALHGQHHPFALGPAFITIALSVAPPLLGVQIVRSLRTVVQLELDLVQVQSTVSSPRFAVGMMASEELARLDLAAERLLDGVATGRTPLPLDEHTASEAASIATELRLHLIQGRRETWLYHAVTESALLGPSVTVSDPDGLAGLLTRDQRDGLLTAIWLLISDPVRLGQNHPRELLVTLERRVREAAMDPSAGIHIPITISATGVPRNSVDPAAWQAIRKVGRYVETFSGTTLRIDIESVVDNPADL